MNAVAFGGRAAIGRVGSAGTVPVERQRRPGVALIGRVIPPDPGHVALTR
jgi:hypothetical protein